eukprot:CAMPEP_0169176046 /NCGR_PEP_ID=MMETSP1015-20121227/65622_1 /TAXON_ID=342587 /ORGANISM="Karlodinium micrum, Strain CCMP2283" /LENGTH=447 /DNA_ID=CAMNT_0009250449 /DNA_START=1 /DNA_END=1345 /DNA_ORIENTATION=+
MPITVNEGTLIVDLMDMTEDEFQIKANEAGSNVELQINVLWNIKDFKKALNPNDLVSKHFVDGETYGIYGDIMPGAKPPLKEENKIPVVILTGFLGSGKTTLLNYMLQEQREKKIAVIENEFGEVSIDDALLKQDKLAMAEEVIVMDNGCMCCTIRGDLANGLQQLLAKIHNGSQIDLIAIETTGMADPVPIVRTFMSDPTLTDELRLDGVVAIADAKNLQLDLISAEEAILVKDKIRDINKFAKILPAVKSRVKLAELSDMRCHDLAHFVDLDLAKEEDVAHGELATHGHEEGHGDGGHGEGHGHDENCTEDHGHGGHGGHGEGHGSGHGGGHGHGHDASRHDKRVNSFAIVREGEIVPKRLSQWMQMLGQLPKERGTVFRIKAILAVKGHPYKHVFHAVMDVSDEDDAGPWEEGEKRVSKIVFIGKAMDQAFLRKSFEDIFYRES